MRCVACGSVKSPACFTSNQKRKPAAARKCSACASSCSLADARNAGSAAGDSAPAASAASHAAFGAAPPNTPPPGSSDGTVTALPHLGERWTPAASAALTGGGAPAPASGMRIVDVVFDFRTPTAPPPAGVCAWVGCGKRLPGDPAQRKRCTRCKQAWYCGRACQKRHWGRGGHKGVCVEPPCCTICLDGGDGLLPVQCGCGCRGDAGLAHIKCLAEVAARKQDGYHAGWYECPTCGQWYTGAVRLGLARKLHRRMRTRRRRDDFDRLAAEDNLGDALVAAGQVTEAVRVLTGVHAAMRRVYGEADLNTLSTASSLAHAYSQQGRYAEAEELEARVLVERRRQMGAEHADTLAASHNLAATHNEQGKLAEAEELAVGLLEASTRLRGKEHMLTLGAASNLASTYHDQGKFAEAAGLQVGLLASSRQVFGAEHPTTLQAARALADTYAKLGREGEAAELRGLYHFFRPHIRVEAPTLPAGYEGPDETEVGMRITLLL